jgi:uncharacterized phage-associated protein
MEFVFKIDKAVQTAAYLIKKNKGKPFSYLSLIKILYLAERQSLIESGEPIFGDDFFAMDYGPVVSNVLNLVRGVIRDQRWNSYIINAPDCCLELKKDPGTGLLCQYEREILDSIFSKFEGMNRWDVVDETHQLPEYIKNKPEPGRREWIPLKDIFNGIEKPELLACVIKNMEEDNKLTQFFHP